MIWALRRAWLRLRRRCPDCTRGQQLHARSCPRQGAPGKRLWSQSG